MPSVAAPFYGMYVVCMFSYVLIASWVGGGNFNEKEQRLKICFRWHPPKGCFCSFSCSQLHLSPSIKITLSLKTFYTSERNLNIEVSGYELFRDLVISLLPYIILHHQHSTLLVLPTQSNLVHLFHSANMLFDVSCDFSLCMKCMLKGFKRKFPMTY